MFGAMFGDQTLVITSISKKGNDDKFMRSCDVGCQTRPPEAPCMSVRIFADLRASK